METNRYNTGDGLIMAREAGAAIAKTVPVLYGGHWVDSGMAPGTPPLISVTTDPITVWLDSEGRRFCDESSFYADFAANGLRRKYTWALFDDAVRERLEFDGPTLGGEAPGHKKDIQGIPGLSEIFEKYTVGRRGEGIPAGRGEADRPAGGGRCAPRRPAPAEVGKAGKKENRRRNL